MANLGEAFKGLNLGLRTGLSITEGRKRTKVLQDRLEFDKEKYEDAKQITEIQNQIAKVKANAELIKNQNERMEMGFDFAKLFITPEEGVTKNQMDSFVKGAKGQFGIDFSSVFQPIIDEKTGNPVGFKLESEETFKKRIDDSNADADRKIRKSELANEKIKTGMMERGIFDTPEEMVSWAASKDPKLQKLFKTDPMQYAREIGRVVTENFPGKSSPHTPDFATKGLPLEIEKNLAGAVESLRSIDNLEKLYREEFLTVPGKLKNWTLDKAAKVAGKKGEAWARKKVFKDESEETLGKLWEFRSELGMNFDTYRHRVTGAQAAVKELKILEKRVLSEDMSSPAFEYALGKYKHRVRRQIRMQRLILSKGVRGDAFWDEFDKMIRDNPSGDPTVTPENIKMRGDQLKQIYSQKYSGRELRVEINNQLRSEGWLK